MKHARSDYNRIQDPENKIPADEPVFLLRGQDIYAPVAVLFWANQVAGAHPFSPEAKRIVFAARQQAQAMIHWQQLHHNKVPDMPAETESK
jgi:hypothetical protein